MDLPEELERRLAAADVCLKGKVHVFVASIYGITGEGDGPEQVGVAQGALAYRDSLLTVGLLVVIGVWGHQSWKALDGPSK